MEYREEVMRHKVNPRKMSLGGFERQVLVGVRRSGKSYLLYDKIQRLIRENGKTWDEILYLNFEDERLAGMDILDLNKILEVFGSLSSHRPILFLDEIQNVEGWGKFVRRLADQKYHIYVTGSNSQMLSTDVSKELGARFITQEVFPYDYEEFLMANQIDTRTQDFLATTRSRSIESMLRQEYFRFGGFPELTMMTAKRDYLQSLYQKIFLGDIAARHSIENIWALRVLFKKLVESIGSPLSFNRASNIVKSTGTKVSTDTIIRYLEYAKDACLIYSLSNFSAIISERESNRKYYFVDNGILSLFANNINTNLLENIVAIELLRRFGSKDKVYYYMDGIEVDFYLPENAIAVQASFDYSSSPATKKRETTALVKLNRRFPCKKNQIVTFESDDLITVDGIVIHVVSLSNFLLNVM